MSETKLKIDLSDSQKAISTVTTELYSGYGTMIATLLKGYGYTMEKFTVTIVNALKKNPKLLNCTKESLLASLLTSAELGLEIDSPMGYCYMIPFHNSKTGLTEAKFIFGYKGIIELLYRSPNVLKVVSEVVYKGEHFVYKTGLNLVLEHEPSLTEVVGERIGTYTIVFLKNGEKIVQYVRAEQIKKIKAFSSVPDLYEEKNDPMSNMWKKAGIKQIIKYTPKGQLPELSIVAERDEKPLTIENGEILALETGDEQLKLPANEFGGILMEHETIKTAKNEKK